MLNDLAGGWCDSELSDNIGTFYGDEKIRCKRMLQMSPEVARAGNVQIEEAGQNWQFNRGI